MEREARKNKRKTSFLRRNLVKSLNHFCRFVRFPPQRRKERERKTHRDRATDIRSRAAQKCCWRLTSTRSAYRWVEAFFLRKFHLECCLALEANEARNQNCAENFSASVLGGCRCFDRSAWQLADPIGFPTRDSCQGEIFLTNLNLASVAGRVTQRKSFCCRAYRVTCDT